MVCYKGQCPCDTDCPDKFGCPQNKCADFTIKQHDTRPPFILSVSDCDGFLDTTNCVAEVSIWAKAKFKKKITESDTYFALVNNIGFEQALVGDIIVVDRARNPEQMLVTGFDEVNKFIRVQRGYNGTEISNYKRNSCIKIFRTLNSIAEISMVEEDVEQLDGTTETELTDSQIIYNWQPNDTCLQGCYWLEIKLLKMESASMWAAESESIIPTFTSDEVDCSIGANVEWVRRFPVGEDAFLIHITGSPTSENLL